MPDTTQAQSIPATAAINGKALNLTIGADGLDACVIAGHNVIAKGGLSLSMQSPLLTSTVQSTHTGAVVTHGYSGLRIVYNYSLNLNDIAVDIAITNTSQAPFSDPAFRLPTFQFSRNADGNMHAWHWTYLAARGVDVYHPSIGSPLACSYAHDDTFGVCLHSPSHFTKRTLVNADWVVDGIIPAALTPTFYVKDSVAPGQTLHVALVIRVAAYTDLPALVGGYVKAMQAVQGPLMYMPDDRPCIATWPEDATWVTPDSPLGFHPGRRLDQPLGLAQYQGYLTPVLGAVQGIIAMQPQGYSPRAPQYLSNFDCFPDVVKPQIKALIDWCSANKLKFMLLAQPRYERNPVGWDADGLLPVSGNPALLGALLSRFKNAKAMGTGGYYLDTFGDTLEDIEILKAIRTVIGTDITFSEFVTDLALSWTGVYTEMMNAAGDTRWLSAEAIRIMRLIQPRATFITKVAGEFAPTLEPTLTADDYGKAKLTPLKIEYLSATYRPLFDQLAAKYLNGSAWK